MAVDEVREEAFHGGLPRVGMRLVFLLRNGVVGAESHGDEPHLFGDAGGLSGI